MGRWDGEQYRTATSSSYRSTVDDVSSGDAALDYLSSILQTGERLVWTGRPSVLAFARRGIGEFFFGAVFFGFASFWTLGASSGSWLFALFGIPFLLVGFWTLIAPLRYTVRAWRTYYAITDQRMIILRTGFRRSAEVIMPSDITRLERSDYGSDRGTVTVRTTPRLSGNSMQTGATKLGDGFFGVSNFKAAMDAIHQLAASPKVQGR
ncbi:hypothetical protein BAL199_13443 [alpha proteobacterium BAL199]|jgi:hypothetical protein|nr:hypothetical protein BAL199_13443 [alpha proteobacterium BAL199]